MQEVDVIIVGAGAAGLMCAIEAGKNHRSVIIFEHTNMPGKKILMSGGGKCNFTNLNVSSDNFISNNPHFCKSALNRYTPAEFVKLVNKHNIPFHEKKHGQLFCNNKSKDIVNLLLKECGEAKVSIKLNSPIKNIKSLDSSSNKFELSTNQGVFQCKSLVVATGGLSIPTIGATPFGYKIAEQFGLNIWPTRAALVPLTLHTKDKEVFSTLSGVSVECEVKNNKKEFTENILFTHRGLSGPAILQISSYWQTGEMITINTLPKNDLHKMLDTAKSASPQIKLKNYLSNYLPKRVIPLLLEHDLLESFLGTISSENIKRISDALHKWTITPNGTEGYRTAEVTIGGVDCNELSSKTMETKSTPGLYFIGEVLDVTGWLGGYNFQWAWSSGWAAGQVV